MRNILFIGVLCASAAFILPASAQEYRDGFGIPGVELNMGDGRHHHHDDGDWQDQGYHHHHHHVRHECASWQYEQGIC